MVGGNDECIVCVSAPGKVILHGEHSVVFGKTAIAASLGMRSSIVLKETFDPHLSLKIHLPSVGIEETLSIQDITAKLKPIAGSWQHPKTFNHESHLERVDELLGRPEYSNLESNQMNGLKGILYLFSAILCGGDVKLNSIEIVMSTQLTVGAGTGSSACFAVILSGALLKFAGLKRGESGEGFTDEQKELVCDWAFNCERIMHGTPSGIDNATCTYGSVVSFRKGSPPERLALRIVTRVLLVDTRVSRETRALAARVAALRARNAAAVDHVMEAIDCVTHTAIQVLKDLSHQKDKMDCEAEYQHLGELWDMNHCLLAALGVSHPSLETIRAAAAGKNLACKLTGAGGGGYAIILIPPSTDHSIVDSLTEELAAQGFTVTETSLGGEGVRLDAPAC